MRTARALLALGALWLTAGCEERADRSVSRSEDAVQPAAAGERPAAVAASKASKISVELLEPGAEPRRELRYDFSAVERQTIEMVMKMAMAVEMGPIRQPRTELPPVHMDMLIAPGQVDPQGALRYDFELTDTRVADDPAADPNVVSAMKAELDKTRGMKGWALVTPRGFTTGADIQVPAGAGTQLKDLVDKMRSQIEQMSAPLPEEAVGVGARWKVVQPIENEMFKFTQTATYKLEQLGDKTAVLEIGLEQSAPPQDINSAGMGGATARLLSLKSGGQGRTEIEFAKLVPRAEVSSSMTMEVEIRQAGQQQKMTTTIDIDMQTRPK